MARYIDADALDTKLFNDGFLGGLNSALNSTPRKHKYTIGEIRGIIQKAPTADVAPVVHGRWIEIERTEYYDSEDKHIDTEVLLRCSACGNRLEIYEGEDGYNYCPRCGTKMNEVTE